MKIYFIFIIVLLSVLMVFAQKGFDEKALDLNAEIELNNKTEVVNIKQEPGSYLRLKSNNEEIAFVEPNIESRVAQATRFSKKIIEDPKFKPLNDFLYDKSRLNYPDHKFKFSKQDLLVGFLGLNIDPEHPEYMNLAHLIDNHDKESDYGKCPFYNQLSYNLDNIKAICIDNVRYEKSDNFDVIHVRGADIKSVLEYEEFNDEFLEYVFNERSEASTGRNMEIEQLFNTNGISCIERKCILKREPSKYEEHQLMNSYPSCFLVFKQGIIITEHRADRLIEINCLEKDYGRL